MIFIVIGVAILLFLLIDHLFLLSKVTDLEVRVSDLENYNGTERTFYNRLRDRD